MRRGVLLATLAPAWLLAILLVRLGNEVKDERLGEKPLSMQGYAPTGRDL